MDDLTPQPSAPLFSSSFSMTEERYADFSQLSYRRFKILTVIFLALILWNAVLLIVDPSSFQVYMILILLSVLLLFWLVYVRIGKNVKLGYQRLTLSEGEDRFRAVHFYADRIVSSFQNNDREFTYDQVNGFFESNSFLLLSLPYQSFLPVSKDGLGDLDAVKAFLSERCPQVKKKKFIRCFNNKTISFWFMIATTVIAVATVAISYFTA